MSMNMNQLSSTVQQAIYENNEGARLLQQCHYDSAVKSFTSVLQILKPVAVIVEDKYAAHYKTRDHSDHDCANTNTDRNTNANANANASSPFNISLNHTKPTDDDNYDENDSRIAHQIHTSSSPSRASLSSQSPVDYASSSSLPSTPISTTHEFPQQQQRKLQHFVFRDPVIIPPHSNIHIEEHPSSSFYSPALFSKFLTIVMYNLALTLHLQAIALVSSTSTSTSVSSNHRQHTTHKSNIQKLLVRSRKLYELAFELQLDTTNVDPLYTLALTNNLGLIYRTLNERRKCLLCFRNLFSTMMYLMDSHNYQTNSQSYEPASSIQSSIKNWDGLLSNAMDILFKHTYEVSAAAA